MKSTTEKYASIMGKGRLIGFIIVIITYFLYITSIIKPYIPVDDLKKFWSLSIDEYLEKTDISAGWSWIQMLGYSDFLNFLGIAILAGISIICYFVIIPEFFKKKDYIYFIIAILEVFVLVSAASGIIA